MACYERELQNNQKRASYYRLYYHDIVNFGRHDCCGYMRRRWRRQNKTSFLIATIERDAVDGRCVWSRELKRRVWWAYSCQNFADYCHNFLVLRGYRMLTDQERYARLANFLPDNTIVYYLKLDQPNLITRPCVLLFDV